MKKIFSILTVLMLVFAMTACGGGTSEPEQAEEDGQNPAMNFVGVYWSVRPYIEIECDGMDGMKATVNWSSSAWENSVWTMSGTFDTDKLVFEYHDCVRTDYAFSEDGEEEKAEEVYVGGHGFMTFTEGDPLTLTWQDDQEHMADDLVFEYGSYGEEEGEEENVGMANPWSETESAETAAEGSGVGSFEIGDMTISLGDVNVEIYRYMDGLAEARVLFPAVDVTIRKGNDPALESAEGDISGDYGEYKYDWTQNVGGLEVKCYGNRKGESTRTIWQSDGYDYSITAFGQGGDDDYGLSADDLTTLVNGIK